MIPVSRARVYPGRATCLRIRDLTRARSCSELPICARSGSCWTPTKTRHAIFEPGQTVQVSYQGKLIKARVSPVLPQFDPSTRTLKVRLEADNPGYMLRPDMFVDVEHTVTHAAGSHRAG